MDTYSIRAAGNHGGPWLPAGDTLDEAETKIRSEFSDLVILWNHFNDSAAVYEAALGHLAFMGTYESFYGRPFSTVGR